MATSKSEKSKKVTEETKKPARTSAPVTKGKTENAPVSKKTSGETKEHTTPKAKAHSHEEMPDNQDGHKKSKQSEAKKYSQEKDYKVGDHIHHELFDDIGTVIETGVTSDGINKMMVEFKKVGKKRLIFKFRD